MKDGNRPVLRQLFSFWNNREKSGFTKFSAFYQPFHQINIKMEQ